MADTILPPNADPLDKSVRKTRRRWPKIAVCAALALACGLLAQSALEAALTAASPARVYESTTLPLSPAGLMLVAIGRLAGLLLDPLLLAIEAVMFGVAWAAWSAISRSGDPAQ